MLAWPHQPCILEINAWTWIERLGGELGRPLTLATVPAREWDRLSSSGVDGVWLMGVWARGEAARKISLRNPDLLLEWRAQLPDFKTEDVSGSPYAIREYSVEPHLGGREGLAEARRQLASRGLRLLLDFVPNHVAPDHPWINQHPEYFVRGSHDDLLLHPADFLRAEENVIARGRDPYFPSWPDTAQLNSFEPALRSAALATVRSIADQCDGVRCDMAMLLINRIFAQTWVGQVQAPLATEYWRDLILQIRSAYPEFLFIAEAYWDLEWELLQMGFDYCYDKRLYDRLVEGNASAIHDHLKADLSYQRRMIRFLENHDEPRAAAVFSLERNRTASVALMTLPGAKLLQEGQFSGAKCKLSVHLGRGPKEPVDRELQAFWPDLISAVQAADLRKGMWQLCEPYGWPDNQTYRNLICWSWQVGPKRYIVALNLSDSPSQGRISLSLTGPVNGNWNIRNMLPPQDFGQRRGEELSSPGLFIDIGAQAFQFLELSPSTS